MDGIRIVPLVDDDREQFIFDNQEAFNYGALEEFGRRDDHFEEDGEIISRKTIADSIDHGEAYIVEFFNSHHPDPNDPDFGGHHMDEQFPDGMFKFEKRIGGIK